MSPTNLAYCHFVCQTSRLPVCLKIQCGKVPGARQQTVMTSPVKSAQRCRQTLLVISVRSTKQAVGGCDALLSPASLDADDRSKYAM